MLMWWLSIHLALKVFACDWSLLFHEVSQAGPLFGELICPDLEIQRPRIALELGIYNFFFFAKTFP